MSYEVLEKQIRALPEEALTELSSFVMYMQYKFGSRPAVNMEQFQKNMAESQAWAKSVGMTEQDIKDAIKEIRAQNLGKHGRHSSAVQARLPD